MNILVFNWRDIKNPLAGGSEVHLFEQAKVWVKEGHKVTVFCGTYPNCSRDDTVDGIEIMRRGGIITLYLYAVVYYLRYLRKKYDVVIDNIVGFPYFTPLFVSKPKVAVIYDLIKDIYFQELKFPFSWVGYFTESTLMPRVYPKTTFITISNTIKNEMIDAGFNGKNIEVIYCGLNENYRPSNSKPETPVITYVGRLKGYKRVDILLRAMQDVLKKVPDSKLVIVGDGDVRKSLESLAKELNIQNNVVFAGFVSPRFEEDKKIRLLQASWLFATASEKEGWCISVLEANACGIPAVALNRTALKESIINGETGLLVENEDEMADAIIRLIDDKSLRLKFSENARRYSEKFRWEKTAKETLSVLERVVREQNAGRKK